MFGDPAPNSDLMNVLLTSMWNVPALMGNIPHLDKVVY